MGEEEVVLVVEGEWGKVGKRVEGEELSEGEGMGGVEGMRGGKLGVVEGVVGEIEGVVKMKEVEVMSNDVVEGARSSVVMGRSRRG
ncbi:hypothetical protein, partial [Micrococcus luteus]|uniref:hypothetical protein n=1 Tax=Micrococcus luteus TaxID=1270 RepID=UPI0011A16145